MPYGLKDIELAKLNEVFAANERIERVILYGSRAKGNYKPFSDVDITLEGDELTHTDLSRLSLAIDDLLLPYQFDISIFHTMKNEALIDHIRRMGITIYEKKSEWKEYKLGEVAEILDYKRKPLSSMERSSRKGGYPYYGASGIIDSIDDYIFDGEHVLISEDGENLRTRQTPIAFLADGKFWVNNHAHILKSDYVHSRLICYYFAQLDLNPYITGAVQPKLSQDSLNRISLFLPTSINERKKIVSILSSLDDKIDLLRRENATLEQMAETLFRQWFVVEAKEGWEEGKLGDEFAFTMGQSPSGDSFNEEGIGIPMYQGNADFGFRFPTKRVFTTQPTRFAEPNDTLISVRAPVGAQNMATEKCCIGRGVAAFRYKGNPSYYSYTYYKLKSLLEEIKQFNDNGTVFGSISKSDFENLDIMIPDIETIEMFQKQVKVIDDKIINNNNEIQTLIQTRDGLLPRLMSGEVKV